MRLQLDEIQSMIRESVATFVRDRVREQAMVWNEQGATIQEQVRALGQLGLLGVLVPEQLGGAGMGAMELVVAVEQLAIGDGGLAAVVAEHNAAALGWLMRDSGAHRELIGALSCGEKIGCAWRETGPIIAAQYADIMVVAGQPTRAVTMSERTEISPVTMLGLRTAGAGEVTFAHERTPQPDPSDAKHVAALVQLTTAAVAVGIGARALQEGVCYSLERTQFGKPIGRFQALQWMTADAAVELNAAKLLLHKAAWLHDKGEPFMDAAARCHHIAVRYVRNITDRALQMHGGYGFTEDYPVERLYRDAYSLHAMADRTDLSRMSVADSLAASVQ